MKAEPLPPADAVIFGLGCAGAWSLMIPVNDAQDAFVAALMATCCALLRARMRRESRRESPPTSPGDVFKLALRVIPLIARSTADCFKAALTGRSDPSGAWIPLPEAEGVRLGAEALALSMCPGISAVLTDGRGGRILTHTLDAQAERAAAALARPLAASGRG